MEGGSPSKTEVEGMIEEFWEKQINRKFAEHCAAQQQQLEESLGKILQAQTVKVNETEAKVDHMFTAAAATFEANEARITGLINDFNNTFAMHKGAIEGMYGWGPITGHHLHWPWYMTSCDVENRPMGFRFHGPWRPIE